MSKENEQHQGEPVAWRYQVRAGGEWYVTTTEPHARMFAGTDDGGRVQPLYTQADPGEVDQLSQVICNLNDERDELGAAVGRLRTQLAERGALLEEAYREGWNDGQEAVEQRYQSSPRTSTAGWERFKADSALPASAEQEVKS